MGLFDFIKPKHKIATNLNREHKTKIQIDNYELLRKETERLQNEKCNWQKGFDTIIKLREKAHSFEKNGQFNDAIQVYIESVTYGEQDGRLSLNNYAHDIGRVIILYGKTKQKENQIKFLKRVISKYPDCRDAGKWAERLSKLTSNKSINVTEIRPSDIRIQQGSIPTLGKQLQVFKENLPRFNFYCDMPEGMQTLEYLFVRKPVPFEKSVELRKYRELFESIISEAKIAENEKNLKRAIESYEKLVAEEYEGKEPYERLMILYKKMGWYEEEKRIIKHAISFFSQLRERQIKNVICLAKEYGMESKAEEYIDEGKKIYYYGGAFELYNPFPAVERWKERLRKLNNKMQK